jgi:4-hydroxyproline epimerase
VERSAVSFTIRRVHALKQVRVVDSHTGGEPTRTIVAGGPDLGDGNVHQRMLLFQKNHGPFRRALVTEPRSSEAMVGALLCEPSNAECVTGVIFFNNSGCLGMCGHGTIGVVVTLAYLGKIKPGYHRIETPVGIVGSKTYPAIDMPQPSRCRYPDMARSSATLPGVATGFSWSRITPLPLIARI